MSESLKWSVTDGIQDYADGDTPAEALSAYRRKLIDQRNELTRRIATIDTQRKENRMTFASEPVKSATYTADDGSRCFALIVEDNGDKVNLAYLDPAVYTWHAANDVPKDSNRLK